MAEHYVVTAIPKDSEEPEPVHPGVLTLDEAEKLCAILHNRHGINVSLWLQAEWEEYVWERDKELFCETCGNFIEDCDCEVQ